MGTPIIGKQITWKSIAEQYCRIKHCTFLAKVENGKVLAFDIAMPYALVEIESPILPHGGSLPVIHRLDFHNLWRIFNARTVADDEEVLIVYRPAKLFASVQPQLVFLIYTKGSLERIYDPQQSATVLAETPFGVLYGLKGTI